MSRRMITIDDSIEAWEIYWTRNFPNVGKEQGKWVIFLKDGNGFVINAFAFASQYEQFEPSLDAIQSNFSFSAFVMAATATLPFTAVLSEFVNERLGVAFFYPSSWIIDDGDPTVIRR